MAPLSWSPDTTLGSYPTIWPIFWVPTKVDFSWWLNCYTLTRRLSFKHLYPQYFMVDQTWSVTAKLIVIHQLTCSHQLVYLKQCFWATQVYFRTRFSVYLRANYPLHKMVIPYPTDILHKSTKCMLLSLSCEQGHIVHHFRWSVDISKCSWVHGKLVDTKETESKMLREPSIIGVLRATGTRP